VDRTVDGIYLYGSGDVEACLLESQTEATRACKQIYSDWSRQLEILRSQNAQWLT
tara:strand:+ start:138 stop:302 length:165 start_codon:yes stop_codon:yes gene_type:complete